MIYVILKQERHEEKRCWFFQEREFFMPVSVRQIIKPKKGRKE